MPPMRPLRWLITPSAGAVTSVFERRHISSRRCASIWARSASLAFKPSRAATSCASASLNADFALVVDASETWPEFFNVVVRPMALRASLRRASASTMALRACAIAAALRASVASFCASCASSVAATRRASTWPCVTCAPFLDEDLEDAQAFDLGPDQDFLARHERAADREVLDELARLHARDADGDVVVLRGDLGRRRLLLEDARHFLGGSRRQHAGRHRRAQRRRRRGGEVPKG